MAQHASGSELQETPTMATLLLLILLVLLPLLYLLRRSRSYGGKSLHLPPSPPSLPVIGHLHLISSMPHHSFAAISAQLNGAPIFHLRLGSVPTVVISSSSLARQALTAPLDASLASRPPLLSAQFLSFGCSDVTFSPAGAYHRMVRRVVVQELLSPRRVAAFRSVRAEEIGRLLAAIRDAAGAGSKINLSGMFLTLANDVLCRAAFGRRLGSAGDNNKLAKVLEEAQELFAGFTVGDFFPEVEWLLSTATGLRRRLKRCLAELRTVCDEIIAEHTETPRRRLGVGGLNDEEDFVDVLLRVQSSPELEVPITDDNLKALVLDMFVAGTDTTSATLEWTMTELARNPTVLKKAQAEVRRVAGAKGAIDEADTLHLHYMRAVVKETFRLHPPVPLLVPRESTARCSLGGYDVPAGTRVFINTFAMNRDPAAWEKPLEFLPERFGDGREIVDVKGQGFDMLPFGGGRRGCPGYSFALATVELTLAGLLYHFDWELPAGVRPEDVDTAEIFGLATRKKEALFLVARTIEQ